MMARRGVLGILGGGLAMMLSGCGLFGGKSRYRYRMTVEIETPSGVKIGSAVHEIAASENVIKLVDGDTAWVSFRGEAFPVDLGAGKALFVLVTSSDPGEESLIPAVNSALDPDYRRGGLGNLATVKKMAESGTKQSAILAPDRKVMGQARPFYPLLVRFEDERKPNTVKEVKPDALASAFGSGYRLLKITVETTSDDVTEGIVKRLPWLMYNGKPMRKMASGSGGWIRDREPEFSDTVGFYSFKREYQ